MQAIGYVLVGIYMQRGGDQYRRHHTRCRLMVEWHSQNTMTMNDMLIQSRPSIWSG